MNFHSNSNSRSSVSAEAKKSSVSLILVSPRLIPLLFLLLATMSDGPRPNEALAAPFPSPDSGQSEFLRIPLVKTQLAPDSEQEVQEMEEVSLDEGEGQGQGQIKNSKYVPEEPMRPAGAGGISDPGEIRQYKLRPDSLDLSSIASTMPDTQGKGEAEGAEAEVTDENAGELQWSGNKN